MDHGCQKEAIKTKIQIWLPDFKIKYILSVLIKIIILLCIQIIQSKDFKLYKNSQISLAEVSLNLTVPWILITTRHKTRRLNGPKGMKSAD